MEERKRFATRVFGTVLGAMLMLSAVTGCTALTEVAKSASAAASSAAEKTAESASNVPTVARSGSLPDAASAAEKISPSVVYISAESQQQSGFGGMSGSSSSSGSGIIIKSDGHILTNNHVIEGASAVTVTIDGSKYTAKVVGTDAATDLAVLKIDKTGLPAASTGTPKSLQVGEWVIAVGFPYGLDRTVTFGIVSGLGRTTVQSSASELTAYTNLIQTDASINPGNSGGALADIEGRVVGVNTLIESGTGENTGIGFAIPIDFAMYVADQLMETGSAQHAYLGVGVGDTTLPYDTGERATAGAAVQSVESGSPAEKAGIEPGDILTKIGDQTIESSSDVFTAVRSHKPNETLSIEFSRDGKSKSASVTLSGKTSQQSSTTPQQQQQESGGFGNGFPNGSGGLPEGHP